MKSMQRTAIRLLGTLTAVLFLLAVALPATARAETNSKLPKGYATDELPDLPPSRGVASPAASASADEDAFADTDPSALTDFHEPLAPYGTWVEHPTYGTVWLPSAVVVGPDFAPYATAGHWETTDDGEWLWVSDYEWGYIPFHYGRWVWISDLGWAWIPGRVYAPAWVVWRVGYAGYIGWAPMPPTYYWTGGVAVVIWGVPHAAYVFCPTAYVYHHHVHTVLLNKPEQVRAAVGATKPYKPANPKPGKDYKPAQPTPGDAGISPKAAAASRGEANPRSKSFARPETTPRPRGASAAAAARPGRGVQATPSSPRGTARALPRSESVPAPQRGATTAPSRSGGSFTYLPPMPSRQAAPRATARPQGMPAGPRAADAPGPVPMPRDGSAAPAPPRSESSSPPSPGRAQPAPAPSPPPAARPSPSPRSAPPSMRPPPSPSRGASPGRGRR